MNEIKPYTKIEIEIADFLRSPQFVSYGETVALFCTKLHKSERSVKSYIANAKRYNADLDTKIQKLVPIAPVQIAQNLVQNRIETNTRFILTKETALAELTDDFLRLKEFAKGNKIELKDKDGNIAEIGYESPNDEINAKKTRIAIVEKIAKLNNWDSQSNDIPPLFTEPLIFTNDAND